MACTKLIGNCSYSQAAAVYEADEQSHVDSYSLGWDIIAGILCGAAGVLGTQVVTLMGVIENIIVDDTQDPDDYLEGIAILFGEESPSDSMEEADPDTTTTTNVEKNSFNNFYTNLSHRVDKILENVDTSYNNSLDEETGNIGEVLKKFWNYIGDYSFKPLIRTSTNVVNWSSTLTDRKVIGQLFPWGVYLNEHLREGKQYMIDFGEEMIKTNGSHGICQALLGAEGSDLDFTEDEENSAVEADVDETEESSEEGTSTPTTVKQIIDFWERLTPICSIIPKKTQILVKYIEVDETSTAAVVVEEASHQVMPDGGDDVSNETEEMKQFETSARAVVPEKSKSLEFLNSEETDEEEDGGFCNFFEASSV